jgi:hypothetical protein
MNPGEPIRFTRLKLFGRSAAHYAAFQQPDAAALKMGRGTHSLLLGGEPVIAYEGVRRGKDWLAFQDAHPGHTILSVSEYERASGMAAAVRANPLALELLSREGVLYEQELAWTRGGRPCAGRVDVIVPQQMVCELKTTRDAKPARFAADAVRRAYAAQLAYYMDGSVETFGAPAPAEAFIISVESTVPHPVVVWKLTPRMLEMGTRIFSAWWEQLTVCLDTDEWPSYASRVLEMDAPDEQWDDGYDDEEAFA